MASDQPHLLTRHLRNLVSTTKMRAASTHDLMEQFVAGRDETALTALVRRHGPMVRDQGPIRSAWGTGMSQPMAPGTSQRTAPRYCVGSQPKSSR
jgi:hypothetical protein